MAATATAPGAGQLGSTPVAPLDTDAVDAVDLGAVDVVVAITDHDDVGPGVDAELAQGVRDHLVLRAPARLVRRPGEDGEAVGQPEVLDDAHRGLLRLGRCQAQRDAGGEQVVEHLDDAVVELALEQPAGLVVHAVAVDDGPQPVAGHADERQSELERWADDGAQRLVGRDRQAELGEGDLQRAGDRGVGLLAQQVAAGKIRALAITGPKRITAVPDVPTMAEAGLPGYEFTAWMGVAVPAGTPPALVARLNAELVRALRTPGAQTWFESQGGEVVADLPEAFAQAVRSEHARWRQVIQDARIKAE